MIPNDLRNDCSQTQRKEFSSETPMSRQEDLFQSSMDESEYEEIPADHIQKQRNGATSKKPSGL